MLRTVVPVQKTRGGGEEVFRIESIAYLEKV